MARRFWRRLLARESSGETTIHGCQLDIDIRAVGDVNGTRRWHRVAAAAQIPSNDQNLLKLDLAKEMGIVSLDYKCGIGDDPLRLQWRRRDVIPGSKSYECIAPFVIREDLPCGVIFGKNDPLKMHPGYPSPFEGAPKQDFDKSYGYTKPRTGSWKKTMMVARKSWSSMGSDKSKAKSRQSSFNLKMYPAPPATNTVDPDKENRTNPEDNSKSSQPDNGAVTRSNAASFPTRHQSIEHGMSAADGKLGAIVDNRNVQPAAEKGTKLATIPSRGSAELGEENFGLDGKNPKSLGDSVAPLQVTESQKEPTPVGLGLNSPSSNVASHTLAISHPPEIASMQWRGADDELQQRYFVSPISPSNEVEGVVTNTSNSSPNVGSGVFVESARSLPTYSGISQDNQVSSRRGDNDGKKDGPISKAAITDIQQEANERNAALYPRTATKKLESEEEEDSRKSTPLQKEEELNKWKALRQFILKYTDGMDKKGYGTSIPPVRDSDNPGVAFPPRQKDLPSGTKPFEPSGASELQFVSGGKQETTIPPSRSKCSNLELENEADRGVSTRLVEVSSDLEVGDVLMKGDSKPPKELKPLTEIEKEKATEDSQTDALQLKYESNSQLAPDQSGASLERSLSTVHDPSVASKRPLAYGNITPSGVATSVKSAESVAEGKGTIPEAKQNSARSSSNQRSRSKRIKRRGKAPKIRSAKVDASQKVDLTPAPGADKYWEFNEELNAYYHIDSDTGSTFWYEDSSEESEE